MSLLGRKSGVLRQVTS